MTAVEVPSGEPGATATTASERALAEVLGSVLRLEEVAVNSNFFDGLGADSMLMTQFCARVRKRDDLPSVSMRDVYQHPTVRALATALTEAAATPVERGLAEVLAGVLAVERVPLDGHFFDDLGADSMLMTQFCARLRKRDDLPSVSIKDIYQHPSIRGLATAFQGTGAAPAEDALAEVLAGVLKVE